MPTFLDQAVNVFFSGSGGVDFLATLFAIPIIVAIIISMLKPFNI